MAARVLCRSRFAGLHDIPKTDVIKLDPITFTCLANALHINSAARIEYLISHPKPLFESTDD
jgi:hypothetical protein